MIRTAMLSGVLLLSSMSLCAQTAPELKSGAPESRPGETDDQKARRLLDEMVKALGGEAWLSKQTEVVDGQTAHFFHGAPTGYVAHYIEYFRFPTAAAPAAERVDFVSARSPILAEGTRRDLVHLYTPTNGFEYTYKGRTELPAEQITEYMRRRRHTLEEVMRTWISRPGVVLIYGGPGERDRHEVEKVSVLSPDNDSVLIEIDRNTHLPLERSFEWRNEQFKDHDVDEEVYGDWRVISGGIMSPMNVTRYKNGDMSDQVFYRKVEFNRPLPTEAFDAEQFTLKKK